jgi:hypothetical protein
MSVQSFAPVQPSRDSLLSSGVRGWKISINEVSTRVDMYLVPMPGGPAMAEVLLCIPWLTQMTGTQLRKLILINLTGMLGVQIATRTRLRKGVKRRWHRYLGSAVMMTTLAKGAALFLRAKVIQISWRGQTRLSLKTKGARQIRFWMAACRLQDLLVTIQGSLPWNLFLQSLRRSLIRR